MIKIKSKILFKNIILMVIFFIIFLNLSKKAEAWCTKVAESSGCDNNVSCGEKDCGGTGFGTWYCMCITCSGTCEGQTKYLCEHYECTLPTDDPCSNCFTQDTLISTPSGEVEIGSVSVGDKVSGVDVDSGGVVESVVEKIYETTRSAYYKLRLSDGTEVKVTGEHPLYAVKKSSSLSFWEYLRSYSLTSRFVSFLLSLV
jgi:hypothetical protein